KKTSEESAAAALDGTELVRAVQSSASVQTTAQAIANLASAYKLSAFAATTSAELAGVISNETGSGALVFATTPTLVTPVLGAATGTSMVVSSYLKTTGVTVASLPAAASAGAGARSFVTDGSTQLILALGPTVTGG